jgi:uncharacterized membrane protein YidH (DUF202 family)
MTSAPSATWEGGPTMNYWLFSAIGLVVTLVIVFVLVAIIENERW